MVKYVCELCQHIFNQKSHYTAHMNRKIPCDKKKLDNISNEKMKDKLKKSKDIIEKLKKENEELKSKNKTDININGDIINNGVINNYNVINIIEHGKEDYSKIDIKKIMEENQVLPNLNYISTVIYYVHCNNELPEYKNIYVSDINRNRAMVYNNGKWVCKDKESTIDKLFDNIASCVDEITENTSKPNEFMNYTNEISKVNPFGRLYNNKNRKMAIKNTENVLYDNKDKIINIKDIKKSKKSIKNKENEEKINT